MTASPITRARLTPLPGALPAPLAGQVISLCRKETAMAKKRVESAPAAGTTHTGTTNAGTTHAGAAHAGAAHAGAAHAGAARPVAELRRRMTARFGWIRDLPDHRDQL